MQNSDELDLHFGEFREYLSPAGRELFRLPEYAQVSRNLVSMANYLTLLKPILQCVAPRQICEIGAYRGISTVALARLAAQNKGELLVVDPAIEPTDIAVEADHVKYFSMLSTEFLATPRNIDIFFIDGDHNYEVVSAELQLIVERHCETKAPILFVHDTGWPCARRDMYYDVSRIERSHPLLREPEIPLTECEFAPVRIALKRDVDFAQNEGGSQNGVQAAVEDFLDSNEKWTCAHLPSLYGMTVIWDEAGVSSELSGKLRGLRDLFDEIAPFLSILEFNRVFLLSELNRHGALWKMERHHKEELNDALSRANAALAEAKTRIAYLESRRGAAKQLMGQLFRKS